ncbi:MAG: DNA-binding response regulator, partial [Chloroflexi bacterium]
MREPVQFSEREKHVIEFLIQGRSNKQIAHALGVSVRAVEFHLSNIYAKLGVSSRTEAALKLVCSSSEFMLVNERCKRQTFKLAF